MNASDTQKRIERLELTIKCFQFILNMPGNATPEFMEWQKKGLDWYQSELEFTKSRLPSEEDRY